ncbi:eukaryotic translation initiation factor 4E binding protein-domain-containing protein [Circinella umbellata]|nr:eukaryotic translation initiation factor 4E binding protein-domain-containing protein [Circinella umbellata]
MSAVAPVNIRRADPNTPLPAEYSTTPHGTIYGSTPGGTRVIYDRSTLLALSNSQLAKTPPTKMMYVAGVTKAGGNQENGNSSLHPSSANTPLRRAADVKREEEEKKKTYNPYAVLNSEDGMFDMED